MFLNQARVFLKDHPHIQRWEDSKRPYLWTCILSGFGHGTSKKQEKLEVYEDSAYGYLALAYDEDYYFQKDMIISKDEKIIVLGTYYLGSGITKVYQRNYDGVL